MTLNPHNAEMASLRLYEAETSIEVVAAKYGLDPTSIIDFSLNVNPFGPPPSAVDAARRALDASNCYPDMHYGRLRRALAARHDVSEDALFFGAGLDDVIKLLIHAWTCEGDAVLIHLPTFPRYELEARLRGCRVVAVESGQPERIDIQTLRSTLQEERIALAFICSPNNPTGATLPVDEIDDLAASFVDTIVIVDEALINPVEAGAIPLTRTRPNLVVLRTYSKYFGLAGFRVGYAVAAPDLVRVAEVGRPPFNLTGPSVEAATAALDDADFLGRCKTTFATEADHFAKAIASIGGMSILGSHANMILVELEKKPAEAADALAARGIVVADATSFRGLERRNALRVSLRDRAANEKLIAALKAIV